MRKLLVTTFVTLDGVMQAPGGPEEDTSGGFTQGGWSANYWDQTMVEVISGIMGKPFDLLLGRRTYDIFRAYWPTSTEPGARELNAATKYIASRSDRPLDWGPSVPIRNVPVEVAALKQGDGPELQVHGSGNLIQTLLRENLIDELHVWTFPVLVGAGKRLFADGVVPSGLRLTNSVVSTSGVVIGTYEPAGKLVTGTIG